LKGGSGKGKGDGEKEKGGRFASAVAGARF